MAIEIDAYDGGQEIRLRLGEAETYAWKLVNIADGDSLSSASSSITGANITAVQTYLTSPEVGYRLTAVSVGTSQIEITLNTALGDIYKHRLVVGVFT